MSTFRRFLIHFSGSVFFSAVFSIAHADVVSDYELSRGDTIRITVYDEPELSMEVRLSDAGTILFPFLGEIRVAGLTISGVERKIVEGLLDGWLVEPKVSISVLEYRPFFINGEVAEPGGFPYQPGLTFRKAVAIAGGFTERASRGRLYVISEGATDKPARIDNLDDEVRPGDIITVEQSFF